MFIGSLPKKVIQQAMSHIDLNNWRGVHVCCSGSFKIEQAIRSVNTTIPIHSNDVSLISSIVGYAKTGYEIVFNFKNDLDYLNKYLSTDAETQLALIAYAMQLGKYKSDNQYCNARRDFLEREIEAIIQSNKERAKKYLEQVSISSFFCGDFIQHIEAAKDSGSGVMVFAPTYKGGYERLYKVINDNVDWASEPSYEIYDPKQTHDIIERLYDENRNFIFFVDQQYDDIKPTMVYEGSNKPIFAYTNSRKSSIRRDSNRARAFKYTAIDTNLIGEKSKVTAVVATSETMNFLKDIYLAKGIKHKNGMFNVLFYVDGMLAGGAIYSLPQFGDKLRQIYILSDFSLSRRRKLSKLIAMLATSKQIIDYINKKYFINIERVLTTAFTKKPVSMKYRGIFRLDAKKDGFLNYSSEVRDKTLDEIYGEWFKKYGQKN
nr:MAG TPA: hypothetical protein [Caudoviricetes sp.]